MAFNLIFPAASSDFKTGVTLYVRRSVIGYRDGRGYALFWIGRVDDDRLLRRFVGDQVSIVIARPRPLTPPS
jgi:hypothetical protein